MKRKSTLLSTVEGLRTRHRVYGETGGARLRLSPGR